MYKVIITIDLEKIIPVQSIYCALSFSKHNVIYFLCNFNNTRVIRHKLLNQLTSNSSKAAASSPVPSYALA